jgi:hypothetical protein
MNIDDRAELVYDSLLLLAEPITDWPEAQAIEALRVEFRMNALIVDQLGWFQPQGTYVKERLEFLECIAVEQVGNRSQPTTWILCIHPKEARRANVNDPRRTFARELRSSTRTAVQQIVRPKHQDVRNLVQRGEVLQDELTTLKDKVTEAKELGQLVPGLLIDVRRLEERLDRLETQLRIAPEIKAI